MSDPHPLKENAEHLNRFLDHFTAGAERLVIELRALNVPRRYGNPITVAGFFDLPASRKPFAAAVGEFLKRKPPDQPEGVYVTLNPVSPDLLARANNRTKDVVNRGGITCTDDNIECRRWLLIDVDPKRPSGVSSTDAEKAIAFAVLTGIRQDLDGRGWPAPMVIDSGNGFHLWYRIDLPGDDGGAVQHTLKALASRHNTDAAQVDTKVYNPSRIAKLPGTWARKGDATDDRPHRMARVLEVPA